MKKTPAEKTEREAIKKEKTGVDVRLIDQWLAEHYEGPEDILGKQGLLAQLSLTRFRGQGEAAAWSFLSQPLPLPVHEIESGSIITTQNMRTASP